MMKLISQIALTLLLLPLLANSQTPCVNGFAGNYPCENMDLLSHMTTDELLAEEQGGVLLNDIWGWTDPVTGSEYAIVGMANGTSFVDVTDPINPVMLGILPEHHQAEQAGKVFHDGAKSVWRDIKVYKNHAFIVSEDYMHGVQIFDLSTLRNVDKSLIPTTFPEHAHYEKVSNAHNIVINEDTGYAYAVGSTGPADCSKGGLHVINIQDPVNPAYAGCFDTEGYTHDGQCVVYNGSDTEYVGKEICFNNNDNSSGTSSLTIVDVDDKSNMTMISKTGYSGSSYSHQGWLTEDHNYFIANDELDEYYNKTNTTTFIWDVRDLDNPLMIGTYVHDTKAIDHNLYIRDNHIYQSNYTNGIRVLDATNVAEANLSEIAYFDTYPSSDVTDFYGTWSNYPYFKSCNLIVSDITGGLFILSMPDCESESFQSTLSSKAELFTIEMYPMPNSGLIQFNITTDQVISSYAIQSLSGKSVLAGDLTTGQKSIDASSLRAGIYMINFKMKDGTTATQKLRMK